MKTVYLCGGINGLSDGECQDWRKYAKLRLNCITLDPMRRDYRGHEAESVNEIVQGDLEDIRKSDILLVNAVRPSWGTAMEIVYAQTAQAKTIVAVAANPVSPWLTYHCDVIVPTLDDAIDYINRPAMK